MKTGLAVVVNDIERGPEHIELLPHLFEDIESVRNYAARRLNTLVTTIICVEEIRVPNQYRLLRCTP